MCQATYLYLLREQGETELCGRVFAFHLKMSLPGTWICWKKMCQVTYVYLLREQGEAELCGDEGIALLNYS